MQFDHLKATMASTKWLDVTSLIDQLAIELPVGGMVQHPDFSLLRSMSAIELMDPKMDTGMCRDVLPTLSERISANTLPLRLSIHHASRVLDTLMCQEMSHRMGCSMPTSIVTCLYLQDEVVAAMQDWVGDKLLDPQYHHHPGTLSDEDLVTACVYTYALALLKCMRIFYNVVKVGDIYEDEDFCDYERYPSPNQEGGRLRLSLGDGVEEETLATMLQVVVAACESRVRDEEQNGGSTVGTASSWTHLLCRLNLRKSWWEILISVRPLCEQPSAEDLYVAPTT